MAGMQGRGLPQWWDPGVSAEMFGAGEATLHPTAVGKAPTKRVVSTVPITAAQTLDSYYATPRGAASESYYDPSILALYASPPSFGADDWVPPADDAWKLDIPAYDPNNPYADYSGIDYAVTDPGMGGLAGGLAAALGVTPPPTDIGIPVARRKMFEGPKAKGNANYVKQAKSTKSESSLSGYGKGRKADDPPTDDTDTGGTDDDDDSPGGTGTPTVATNSIYSRTAQFPNLPPYRPGIDPEPRYFKYTNKAPPGWAHGGIVHYAEGGAVNPMAGQDPRVEIIAAAEDALENAIAGQPQPDDQGDIAKFVETFGEGMLEQLKANVTGGMKMRPGKGRMVEGPGGPTDDAVPALIEGKQPAALSDGEFVMSADAVAGAGGPEALQQLHDQLAARGKAA